MTHRAVAERAGLPLSATTYWFESMEVLLKESLLLAAREEVERVEGVVLALANPRPRVEGAVFRPALERLFGVLTEQAGAVPA